MILIERMKLYLYAWFWKVSDCSMKNVIYKYFISHICWVICITPMLFDELYEINGFAGYFSNLQGLLFIVEITSKG